MFPILIQILVALFCVCSAVAILLIASPFLSRLVDRRQVRPSVASGAVNVGAGFSLLVGLVFCDGLYVLTVVCSVAAATLIAHGIEQIRASPDQEYRPFWYRGSTRTAWASWSSRSRPLQISVFSAFVFFLVLCVASALVGWRVKVGVIRQNNHDQAETRIKQLGGQVQGTGFVTLAGTSVSDQDLAVIRHFRGITDLNLGATTITNRGLHHIATMRRLSALNLSGTNVNDAGLTHISALKHLRTIRLRQTNVTGTAFPLRASQRWLSIDLSRCPIAAEGLHAISQVDCKNLSIGETDVDDTMLDALVLLNVETLDISGTKLSSEAIDQLSKARPDIQLLK